MGRIENLEDYDVPPLGIVCPDPVRTDIYRKKFGRYKEYYDAVKPEGISSDKYFDKYVLIIDKPLILYYT